MEKYLNIRSKIKILTSLLGALLMIITAYNATAQVYQGGQFKVASLRFSSSGLYIRFSPALTACQGGNQYRMHAKVPRTQANFKDMTSALLTAYTAEQTILYVWLSGEGIVCSHTHILNLDMIELTHK